MLSIRDLTKHFGVQTAVDRLTLAALEAVLRLDALAQGVRSALTAQYIEHATRSSRIEHQLWSALFDHSQAFLVAYAAFMQDLGEHAQSGKWQALLPLLIERQIVHMGLEAKVRLYRYEQWIPAKWAELHGLFSLACTRQIERRPVDADRGRASTIEHAYLTVLVLQLMNAGNLTARHLEWVAGELDEWCAPLRLTLEPTSVSSFYVDLGGREGLRRRAPAPLEGRVLFLDTRPLHAVLSQNIVTIEQKIRHQPLSDKTPRRTEQLTLLTKLAAQVDPEYRPFARRGERTAAVGVVDAIVGILRDDPRRHAMRKKAYLLGREMVWSKSAQRYMEIFQNARDAWSDSPARSMTVAMSCACAPTTLKATIAPLP